MALLRSQLFRIRRQTLSKGIVFVLAGLVLLRGVVWPPDPSLPWSGLWSYTLVAAAVIILSSTTVGQEFAGGTFRSLVSRGVPRWQFLAGHFAALVLVAGVLLAGTEGLATLLGIRQGLRWAELARAWMCLWPYVALVTLLAVVARSGGLALIVGILQLAFEQFFAMFMGPMALMSEAIPEAWRAVTHLGVSGTLYQWSLSYNSANWTYLGNWLRAPTMINLLMYVLPSPAARSAVILAGYTAGALGLCTYILYRRDVTEVVVTNGRLRRLVARPRRSGRPSPAGARVAAATPVATGHGPLLVRLVTVHLLAIRRMLLVRVGVIVVLAFAFVLWGISRLVVASGFGDTLYATGAGSERPLVFAYSLLVVGPLATVLGVRAVGEALELGVRRGELARGLSRAEAIVGQSVALAIALGGLLAVMLAATMLAALSMTGIWHLEATLMSLAAGVMAAGAYLGTVQIGGALTRSGAGATLFGLGFLLADWLCLLAPSFGADGAGLLPALARYSVTICALSIGWGGPMRDPSFGWRLFDPGWAFLWLLAYALVAHGLAIVIARRRDA
jgi:ABC-type transport system involved in multi-copper enzyme maturation permease subunit